MTKAMMQLGYRKYVLDLKDAVNIATMLSQAELYEQKWLPNDKTTHHIYPCEEPLGTIDFLTDTTYQMYKLAGKPQDN